MDEIKLKAMAKINLSLDIINKRPDGYHNVKMVMQQVGLYDEVYMKKIQKGIMIETNCSFLPTDSSNIAFKAARDMIDRYNIQGGVYIYIKKNIPIAAGLAGGSSNGAEVIKGINELYDLNLSLEEMMGIGAPIGADIPFCILGGCAVAEGIGEKLTSIKGLDKGWLVLSKPNIGVSTVEAYNNLDIDRISERPDTERLLKALEEESIYDVARALCNVFEEGIHKRHPIVRRIKKRMLQYGALGSIMTGSGPTVFGIFKDYEKAKSASEKLRRIYKQTYLVRSYNGRHYNE